VGEWEYHADCKNALLPNAKTLRNCQLLPTALSHRHLPQATPQPARSDRFFLATNSYLPTAGAMESLFHHFALPQRLPGSEEDNLDEIEGAFVNRLDRAAWTMRTTSGQESDTLGLKITAAWQSIRRLLFAAKTVNPGGIVNGAKLQAELGSMAVDGALLVYVGSQNAALFIYRLSRFVAISSSVPTFLLYQLDRRIPAHPTGSSSRCSKPRRETKISWLPTLYNGTFPDMPLRYHTQRFRAGTFGQALRHSSSKPRSD